MYGPVAYWTASSLISVPVCFVAILFSLAPLYAINDFPPSTFARAWLIVGLLNVFFDAFIEVLAFSGQSVGTVVIGLVIINALNCVGAFTSIEDIFWPYKIFAYILPPHFVFQSIAYMVFHDSDDFAGTEVATNATTAGREALASGRNFYCPDNVCFGRTGDEILQQLNVRSHSHNSSLPRHPRCQHP